MGTNLSKSVNDIFNIKEEWENQVPQFQSKVDKLYGKSENSYNPFLKKDGTLFNEYIDYQKVLDNPNVTQTAKKFISQATGLSPTPSYDETSVTSEDTGTSDGYDGTNWGEGSSDGALQNTELKTIAKNVSKQTGVPVNIILAVAQQETGGKWIPAADGNGHSYGYMMLYDYGVIADLKAKGQTALAEKAKTDPYTNVLVAAQYLKQFYDKTGSWQSAAARYNGSGTAAQNYGSKVWSRANLQAYKNAGNSGGSSSSSASSSGNKYVDTAKKYLGTPYVWGGTSPSGFDCSGLMYYVYAKNGKTIPRTSQAQFASGTSVSKENLQPGDLVFFKGAKGTMSAPGHVGMYIGNGQYIQAPKTGDVVKISNLSGRSDYAGARRY